MKLLIGFKFCLKKRSKNAILKLVAISINTTTYFLEKSFVVIVGPFLSDNHVPIKSTGLVKGIQNSLNNIQLRQLLKQAYRALQTIRLQVMNQYGTETTNIECKNGFGNSWCRKSVNLTLKNITSGGSLEMPIYPIVRLLIDFYPYLTTSRSLMNIFKRWLVTVSHHDSTVLQQLLSRKLTQLPQPLQKTQRTLQLHKHEIMRSSIAFNVILLMGWLKELIIN